MRIFYNVLELMVSAKSLSAERRKLSENAEISNHYRKYSVRMSIFYNVLEMMVSAKSPSAERRKLSLNAEISKQVYIITIIENMGRGLLWPAIGRSSAYRRLTIGALGRLHVKLSSCSMARELMQNFRQISLIGLKKLFPCCSSRKHRVDHRYTCDIVFIITLYWSFSDLPVASSRISRVLARCKVIMRLFYLTEQVGMLNLKSERKKNMKNK